MSDKDWNNKPDYNKLMNNSTIHPPPPGLDGLTWQPVTRDDLARLVELAGACFQADGGLHFMAEAEEIINRFFPEEPGAGIGALNAEGQLVACCRVSLPGSSSSQRATIEGYVRPEMRGKGLGTSLMRWSQAQAGSLLAGGAAGQRVLQIRTEGLTETASRLYEAHGYKRVFEELVMRRNLDKPLPDPALPADVTVTDWQPELAGPFFQAYHAAFRERPGFPGYKNAAEWVDSWTTDHFRPEWSLLARTGEAPLGFLTGTFDPPHGLIMQVGVIPAQRRRGIASGLIFEVMRRMQAAKAVSAQLVVNGNNPGAIQTYIELGFGTIGKRARYERVVE
jgi:mycothiol synthase